MSVLAEGEKAEIRRLRKIGADWHSIAKMMGRADDTVRRAVDPDFHAKLREKEKAKKKRSQERKAAIIVVADEPKPFELSRLAKELGIRRVTRRIAIHTTVSSSGEGYATVSLPHVSLIDGPREAAE